MYQMIISSAVDHRRKNIESYPGIGQSVQAAFLLGQSPKGLNKRATQNH